MKKIFSKKRGFTIVETLVAISILSLSIDATFTAVQNGLSSSGIAKNQITAFYMIQEGVEYVKNMRDENALHSIDGTPVDWLTSISSDPSDPCYFGNVCVIDSPLKTVAVCPTPTDHYSCPDIRQDATTSLFGYTGSWTPTSFKRSVSFEQISADEVQMIVSVSWMEKSTPKLIQVRQLLFNH